MTRPPARVPVRVVVAALLTLIAIAGLIALGNWQIQRRMWKLDLIARVDAGLIAPPVAAPATAGPDDAYRRVFVTGRFLAGKDSFVQASTARGPGWWVITPLRVDLPQPKSHPAQPQSHPGEGRGPVAKVDVTTRSARQLLPPDWPPAFAGEAVSGEGGAVQTILINRGYVTERRPPPVDQKLVTITGLLRLTEPHGGFLRANDPARDRWYSRDIAAIVAKRGLGATAPYFIDADAGTNAPGQPIGGLTVIAFPNNHLVYALTWYSLAMMVAGAFVIFLRTQRAR